MTALAYQYSKSSHHTLNCHNQPPPNLAKCWREDEFKEALKRDILRENNPYSMLNLPADIISDCIFPYLDYKSLVKTFALTSTKFLQHRDSRLYQLYYDKVTIKCLMTEFKRVYKKGTPFVIACERGDLEVVRLFVAYHDTKIVGCNLEEMLNNLGIDSYGRRRSPLMVAAANEHVDIVQHLLELGVDSSVRHGALGFNAMHFAVLENVKDLNTIKLLFDHMHKSAIVSPSPCLPLDLAYVYRSKNPHFKNKIIDFFNKHGIVCGLRRAHDELWYRTVRIRIQDFDVDDRCRTNMPLFF